MSDNLDVLVLGLIALGIGSVAGALALAFFGRGGRRGGPPPEAGD
jgi:hypothetical protein